MESDYPYTSKDSFFPFFSNIETGSVVMCVAMSVPVHVLVIVRM